MTKEKEKITSVYKREKLKKKEQARSPLFIEY